MYNGKYLIDLNASERQIVFLVFSLVRENLTKDDE